jgi:DNA-binding protein YbaB
VERPDPTAFGIPPALAARFDGQSMPAAVSSIMEDLTRSLSKAKEAQQRMLEVTGEAGSADGLIKAVVGPRGQLVEVQIDPRVYRKPNSIALAASIVATVQAAVEESAAQTQEIVDEILPSDMQGLTTNGPLSSHQLLRTNDADLAARMEEIKNV